MRKAGARRSVRRQGEKRHGYTVIDSAVRITFGRHDEARHVSLIFASSLGTVFEWYDFYIYGTLTANLTAFFFKGVPANIGFIFTAADLRGRLRGPSVRRAGVRPLRRHDRPQVHLPGDDDLDGASAPSSSACCPASCCSWGIAAPMVLIGLRLLQGLALGGEYGGAATFVAEHAPQGQARPSTPRGSRPPRRSACSWRCCWCSASAP